MTKEDLETKIIALDPSKEYLIAVSRKSGIPEEQLYLITTENKKVTFLLCDDVNQIKSYEWQDVEELIKHQREKKNNE